MRKLYGLYLLLASSIAVGFLFPWLFFERPLAKEIDMGSINHIVNSVMQVRTPEELKSQEFAYEFTVFDGDSPVYKSNEKLPDSINESIRQGMLVADSQDYPDFKGRILIDNGLRETYDDYQAKWERWILILFLSMMLCLLLYYYYVNRTILRPFKKLSGFAGEVAGGRLDAPLFMDRHNIFGAFTESFDMMRDNLKAARHREIEASRSKKEMIASLSHDIKTPITVIRLHLEFLQMQIRDENQLEKVNAIEAKIGQIDYLINNLLQNTLEELGHLEVITAHEDSRILPDIMKAVNIREKINIQPVPTCLVTIDRKRMEQVFANILYNAVKYAGTDVDVTFTMADPFLQMDISDRGKGVADTELQYLCEKFFRGQTAIALGKEGEGLGLYISDYLMKRMNGELICINKPDGFTVRLLIPLSH